MAKMGLEKNVNNRLRNLPKLPTKSVPLLPQLNPPQIQSKPLITQRIEQKSLQINLPKKPVLPSVQINLPDLKKPSRGFVVGGKGVSRLPESPKLTLPEIKSPQKQIPIQLPDLSNKIKTQFKLEVPKIITNQKQPFSLPDKPTPNLTRQSPAFPTSKPTINKTQQLPQEKIKLRLPDTEVATPNSKLKLPQQLIPSPSSKAVTPKSPDKETATTEKKQLLRSNRSSSITFSDL